MANILLIDDHADLRDVMKELLEMHGHQVCFAASGEEAFSKLQDGEGADVVIADQRLPGMSGIDFLHKVREKVRQAKLPVILCSADGTLREAAIEAGVDDFWLKGSDQLFEQISNLQHKIEELRGKPEESNN